MGKEIIYRLAPRGKNSKDQGGERNQRSCNYIHPCSQALAFSDLKSLLMNSSSGFLAQWLWCLALHTKRVWWVNVRVELFVHFLEPLTLLGLTLLGGISCISGCSGIKIACNQMSDFSMADLFGAPFLIALYFCPFFCRSGSRVDNLSLWLSLSRVVSFFLSLCLYFCLSVCLPVCLSVCLSVDPSVQDDYCAVAWGQSCSVRGWKRKKHIETDTTTNSLPGWNRIKRWILGSRAKPWDAEHWIAVRVRKIDVY